jgi:uncharacterized protein
VRLQLPTNQPVVLLRETAGTRFLPIWIGPVEATAIAYAVEGLVPLRPLTHDLLKSVTESLGGTVSKVVVTELRDAVFHADLVLNQEGREVHVSARPSDAIALAVRSGAPLFAASEVIEDAGVEIKDADEESEIEKFREFLDEVTPEDFVPPPEQPPSE